MVNPVSSSQSHQASDTQSKKPKPQQTPQSQQQKSPLPSDTVSLKSTSGAKQAGDSQ
jgi:hypothetical protein